MFLKWNEILGLCVFGIFLVKFGNSENTALLCPSDPSIIQYYADSDCTKYWQCSNGEAYQHTCPSAGHLKSTNWNPEKKVCDWAAYAGCSSEGWSTTVNPPITTTTTTATPTTATIIPVTTTTAPVTITTAPVTITTAPVTTTTAPVTTTTTTPTTTGPKHGKVVVCYLNSSSIGRQGRGSFDIENLEPSLCTHIIYSFAKLNTKEGSIQPSDPELDLIKNGGKGAYQKLTNLKLKYPHLKVSLAVRGFIEGSFKFLKLAANAARRSKFVANAVDFIRKYNFDGLEIDWEFPRKRGGASEDKSNFVLLVKELNAAFRKHNLIITAAFNAGKGTIDVAYNVSGLSENLDFIHMMCYDYHGYWYEQTDASAPLRSSDGLSVENSIKYMLERGAPPNKLVLGVQLGGITFDLPKPYVFVPGSGLPGPFRQKSGFLGYPEICLELKNQTDPWKVLWVNESSTLMAIRGYHVITFDNADSLYDKVKFAMENNLAGIMVWSVDSDDFQGDCADSDDKNSFKFPLLRAINESIHTSLEEIKNGMNNSRRMVSSTEITVI